MSRPLQLLTRSEAAEALHQSLRKVDYLIASGDIPTVRIGRSVRIRQVAIDKFINARESRVRLSIRRGKAMKATPTEAAAVCGAAK